MTLPADARWAEDHPRSLLRRRLEVEELEPLVLFNATTWTGAVNTNWTNAGNYTNGVPTATTDLTINNVANAPVISAGQRAICSSIRDNNGSSLTIQSQGSLEITGQSGSNSTWNASLTVNGVLEVDNPNNNKPGASFNWSGGTIQGTQNGTNPWGIYVCGGTTWNCWQLAPSLAGNNPATSSPLSWQQSKPTALTR